MQSTTSTMPVAEQSRAVGTEAYPPLEGEDAPVGLVLIDEDLQSGVDDLDLPAHAGEPPCALDEVVPQVDYCPCHDIELAAGDIIVNVGPSGRGVDRADDLRDLWRRRTQRSIDRESRSGGADLVDADGQSDE